MLVLVPRVAKEATVQFVSPGAQAGLRVEPGASLAERPEAKTKKTVPKNNGAMIAEYIKIFVFFLITAPPFCIDFAPYIITLFYKKSQPILWLRFLYFPNFI
jgi:hypothetical protein